MELRIACKYDHEAYKLVSKLKEVRIPRISGITE